MITQDSQISNTQSHHLDTAMLTAGQAHELAGGEMVISRASWYLALRRREIPNVRVGKRILIPRHAFMNWLRGDGDARPDGGRAA